MASGSTLPGSPTPDDDEPRVISHVDMDCFYAACERLREPGLDGKPVIVGMGYEAGDDGGVVATASYEAREFGIASAQPIADALAALPRAAVMPDDYAGPVGYYRPVDMAYYRSISEEVLGVLESVADRLCVASLDEAYLDVTSKTNWASAEAFGRALKRRIASAVGVPASVGIAPTLGVAKIASDHDKPDGLTVVPPGAVTDFLAPLPLEDLHGVGPVTASALHDLHFETIGDVAQASPDLLEDRFGERGLDLARRARGIGSDRVTPRGDPKSLSRESSLGGATDDFERIATVVRDLAHAVAERAARNGALYRTVGIKIVTPPFEVNTRERSFPGPFADAELLESTALELLEEFDAVSVRKVGVRVANLAFDVDQGSLDEWADASDASDGSPSVAFERQGRLSDFD